MPRTSATKYTFPYDNPGDYTGKITFRVYKTTPPGVATAGSALDSFLKVPEEFTSVSDLAAGTTQSGGPTSGWSEMSASGMSTIGNSLVSAGTQEINLSAPFVVLYLPAQINITDGANYEQAELGTIGALVADQMNKGVSALSAVEAAVKNQISTMVDLLTTNPTIATNAGRLAAVKVASMVSTTGGNVASTVFRAAVNPNRRQLFRGVNLREFSFNFKMIANSAREAQEIDNIIKFFRTEMYPESVAIGEEGSTSIGYVFPNLFDIVMSYNGNQVATKIAPSFLRNVDVVYNPSSMGFHVDGKASEIDLRLVFAEERTLDKSDIKQGF